MKKLKYIFLLALVLMFILGLFINQLKKTDKVYLGNEVYIFSEIETDHWLITGGEFWIKGYDQGYAINEIVYIDSEALETSEINADFSLYAVDENGNDYEKTIFSYNEAYDDNRKYKTRDVIMGGGATGQLPNENYSFIFDYMYFEISYISNGNENFETIKIPLTKEE